MESLEKTNAIWWKKKVCNNFQINRKLDFASEKKTRYEKFAFAFSDSSSFEHPFADGHDPNLLKA